MIAFCCKGEPAGNQDNDDSVKNEECFNYALVRRTQDGYLTLDLQYGMCQLSKGFTTS